MQGRIQYTTRKEPCYRRRDVSRRFPFCIIMTETTTQSVERDQKKIGIWARPYSQTSSQCSHQVSPYVKTFRSLREWVHHDEPISPYPMIIHASRWTSPDNVRRYNRPDGWMIAVVIPENEREDKGTLVTVLRRRVALSSFGNEVLVSASVRHR